MPATVGKGRAGIDYHESRGAPPASTTRVAGAKGVPPTRSAESLEFQALASAAASPRCSVANRIVPSSDIGGTFLEAVSSGSSS